MMEERERQDSRSGPADERGDAALQGADYPAPLGDQELAPRAAASARLERLPDGSEVRARVEDHIREHPLLSIGLGVVAGFLLGRALRD